MQGEPSAPKHRIVVHNSSVTELQLSRTLHGEVKPREAHLTIFADRILPKGPELSRRQDVPPLPCASQFSEAGCRLCRRGRRPPPKHHDEPHPPDDPPHPHPPRLP